MTRKKVKLAYITNDSARKATYKKRKRGLLKKMDELTTLCDVKACAVLYTPYESRPVVWPSPAGAREVMMGFKRLPEMEKVKKMVSQEEFLRQRMTKAHEQLKKQQKDNREKDMTQVMYQCLTGKSIQNMSTLDLSDLSYVIHQNMGEIKKRIAFLKTESLPPPIFTPSNLPPPILPPPNVNIVNNVNMGSSLPTNVQEVGPKMEGECSSKVQFDDLDDDMQQWTSFMEMICAPLEFDPPQSQNPPQHDGGMGMGMSMGMVNGLSGVPNGGAPIGAIGAPIRGTPIGGVPNSGSSTSASTSNHNRNNNKNDANMMNMMMGQFGDYHLNGNNPSYWSNTFFSG